MKKRIKVVLLSALLALTGVWTVPAGAEAIPDERLLPRLTDETDLLTDEEEESLLTQLDEISERQSCDVVVAAVDGLDGKSAMEYADDFYDYNGYGMGTERDGIILLVSMEERDWWISTCGFGITAFTDEGLDYISEKFLPDLSDGKYADAFSVFAELCDDFITQAKTGDPYHEGNMPKEPFDPFLILVDLAVGLGLGYVIAFIKKGKLKSVRGKADAEDYSVPGSFVLTMNSDRFIRKFVTSRKIEVNNNSSSGGSTTHTSSSGTTHGGSGGKF